jgi:hypothetical protein
MRVPADSCRPRRRQLRHEAHLAADRHADPQLTLYVEHYTRWRELPAIHADRANLAFAR